MKQNIIVLHANGYSFEDAKGKHLEGVSLQYMLTDSMEPQVASSTERGVRVSKESLDITKIDKINKVPGIYEGTFQLKAVANGSPKLKLYDIDFIETLFVKPLGQESKVK